MARRLVNRRYSASLVAACVLTVAACGDDERSAPVATIDGKPVVVVTYSILGDMVQQLVGDAAAVVVVIPNGQDPHDFSASARDIETMMGAALLVSNGLGLEEGLLEAIHQAADDQVPVFEVADHITVRQFGEGEPTEAGDAAANTDDHANADDHAPDGGDPHLWTSPAVMAEMLPDLAASLEAALGVQLDDSLAAVQADLAALDAATAAIMASIPAGECKLVTGHESLGYFADHYGCRLIGAVTALTLVTLGGAFTVVSAEVNAVQERRLDHELVSHARDEARDAAQRDAHEIRERPGPFANGVGPLPRHGVLYDRDGAARGTVSGGDGDVPERRDGGEDDVLARRAAHGGQQTVGGEADFGFGALREDEPETVAASASRESRLPSAAPPSERPERARNVRR
jgi:zinc/manganese transport system substrate-binding protein